jgi:ribosomal protein S18 acetylase RimI-like enzyme
MTTVHIRTMSPADLDFAAACTEAVGWGAQRDEFELFYAYDPQGCLIAETEDSGAHAELGVPAKLRIGICVATPYDGCGFIGMLIVLPEARGRGVGRRLLERAVAYLHGRGAHTLGLDGVLAAVPLYERLGFRKQCRSLRFSGVLQGRDHPHVRPMHSEDLDAICALDRAAFGADRRFFLTRRLVQGPTLCRVLEQEGQIAGYILGRRAGESLSAGPWVVHPEVERPADLLASLALEAGENTIGLGTLESNTAAVETARALGFTARADSPWRMVRVVPGARTPGQMGVLGASPLAYAVGSPAKG